MKETFEDIRLREVEAVWEIGETRKEAFRLLAAEAAAACERPIAMVSFVDRTYQWIKAHVGMPKMRMARSSGLCEQAMMRMDFLEVPDLTRVAQYAGNPLVTGSPHLRAYAGVPILSTRGFPLGALCVLDIKAGALAPEQKAKLTEISQRVMAGLDPARDAIKRERLMPNRSTVSDIIKLAAQRSFAVPEQRPKFFIHRLVTDELYCDEYASAHELAKIFVRFAAEGARSLTLDTECAGGLVTVAVSNDGSSARKLYLRSVPALVPAAA